MRTRELDSLVIVNVILLIRPWHCLLRVARYSDSLHHFVKLFAQPWPVVPNAFGLQLESGRRSVNEDCDATLRVVPEGKLTVQRDFMKRRKFLLPFRDWGHADSLRERGGYRTEVAVAVHIDGVERALSPVDDEHSDHGVRIRSRNRLGISHRFQPGTLIVFGEFYACLEITLLIPGFELVLSADNRIDPKPCLVKRRIWI